MRLLIRWIVCVLSGAVTASFMLASAAYAEISAQKLELAEQLLERVISLEHLDIELAFDRLEKEIATEVSPRTKAGLYHQALRYAVSFDDKERIRQYANQLILLARQNENTEQEMIARLDLIYADAMDGKMQEAADKLGDAFRTTNSRELQNVKIHAAILMGLIGPDFGQQYEHIQNLKTMADLIPPSREGSAERLLLHLSLAYLSINILSLDEAIDHYAHTLDLAIEYGFAIDRETILYNIAFTLLEHQANAKARAYFRELLRVVDKTGTEENKFYGWYGLALAWLKDGNYEKSLDAGNTALQFDAIPFEFRLSILQVQTINLARLGKVDEAKSFRQQFINFRAKHAYLSGSDWAGLLKKLNGEILVAEGNLDEGLRILDEYYLEMITESRNLINKDVLFMRGHLEASLSEERAKQSLGNARAKLQRQTLFASLAFATLLMIAIFMQVKNSRALKVSTLQARRASKAKTDFLAVMSHELRTPLNAVIGFSDIMRNETVGPLENEKYKEYVNVIHESGSHLLDIINDILDLAKIESGHMVTNEDIVDLDAKIKETIRLVSARAGAHTITLLNKSAEKLPLVLADERMIKQMLINLASNAVKFTPAGGSVSFMACQMADKSIQIEIADTGIGMEPREIARALRPFEQIQSAFTRDQQGTGLGLPLVKSQIEMLGGSLELLSKPGEGTRAILTMPARRIATDKDVEAMKDNDSWI